MGGRSWFIFGLGWMLSTGAQAETLRAAGSLNATAPLMTAVPALQQRGIEVAVDTESTSSTAIAAVGQGRVELGAAVRTVTAAERATFPQRALTEHPVGVQVVAPLVAAALAQQGVKTLTAEQVRGIYEGRTRNWREVGGPDLPIRFLNPAQGDGVWELFATWVYGAPRRAPLGEQYPLVEGLAATRRELLAQPGGLTFGFAGWADGQELVALPVANASGAVLAATPPNLAQGYPLARTLYFITAGKPAGALLRLLEFMRTEEGARALREHDFLPFGK